MILTWLHQTDKLIFLVLSCHNVYELTFCTKIYHLPYLMSVKLALPLEANKKQNLTLKPCMSKTSLGNIAKIFVSWNISLFAFPCKDCGGNKVCFLGIVSMFSRPGKHDEILSENNGVPGYSPQVKTSNISKANLFTLGHNSNQNHQNRTAARRKRANKIPTIRPTLVFFFT